MRGWGRYVPVAERRAKARRALKRRLGKTAPQPIHIEGRQIARTFWGTAWCDHLLKFADFANRLPRGATYARNGSVVHLEIGAGGVDAYVAGSELYQVKIRIDPLTKKHWRQVRSQCEGNVGSLIELLEGQLSRQVMRVVTDKASGLFPQPRAIKVHCDCPDWARVCKHVAAVMYGVGARLDVSPELLFTLRGVDHEELVTGNVDAASAVAAAVDGAGATTAAPRLAEAALGSIFGIELDLKVATAASTPARRKRATRTRWTGAMVRRLRIENGLDVTSLSSELGVSEATIRKWEASTGTLRLGAAQRRSLERWREYLETGDVDMESG